MDGARLVSSQLMLAAGSSEATSAAKPDVEVPA